MRKYCGQNQVKSFKKAHQNMPDVLIGSLIAAEANTGPQQALAPPHVTGHHLQLTNPQCFGAVHLHLHQPLHVGFQNLLQMLVLLILVMVKVRKRRRMRQNILQLHGMSRVTKKHDLILRRENKHFRYPQSHSFNPE